LLDIRITDELAAEGMAREVIRRVQDARKNAGLQIEDHIILGLQTDAPKLLKAIELYRDHICRETQADELILGVLSGECHREDVKIDGQALTITLRKV